MDKNKIIILDFATAEVHIYDYDTNVWEDAEEFLEELKFSSNECQWMIVEKLKLEIH